jgi:outer membrane protein OmpA-like peptidoglycan-associated protein
MLLAATVLAIPAAAMAQPVTGIYIGGNLGANWEQNVNLRNVAGTSLSGSGLNFHSTGGLAADAAVGYGLGNGLRLEVQANWYNNHYRLTGGQGIFSGGGNGNNFGGFVNALYDFYLGWPVVPFVGAGVGYEATKLSGGSIYSPGLVQGNIKNSTQGGFAAQAMLGAAFPIPAVPGLAVTAEYRFMAVVQNETFSAVATLAGVPGSFGTSVKIGNQYDHAILVGFRYNFGAAPPPPPPAPAPMAAPAPAPARTYLVFFDWDKATLTDRARQIIGEAAQNSTRVQVTRIEVNGYTDTSGTPKYNMGLSVRRANAVAAELVKDGVPKNIIAIQGFGQTHLLVPTGPGVREPQNRRVEIILH